MILGCLFEVGWWGGFGGRFWVHLFGGIMYGMGSNWNLDDTFKTNKKQRNNQWLVHLCKRQMMNLFVLSCVLVKRRRLFHQV